MVVRYARCVCRAIKDVGMRYLDSILMWSWWWVEMEMVEWMEGFSQRTGSGKGWGRDVTVMGEVFRR